MVCSRFPFLSCLGASLPGNWGLFARPRVLGLLAGHFISDPACGQGAFDDARQYLFCYRLGDSSERNNLAEPLGELLLIRFISDTMRHGLPKA
jgi:hypothetical protein